jgi:tRNA (guanosine-2'-O-)-methyltransferase
MSSSESSSMQEYGQPVAKRGRSGVREKADAVRPYRCNTLICVLENPQNMANIGTVIRNINALGVGKLYVVDGNRVLGGQSWQQMRSNKRLMETSASAIKWTYTRRFDTTAECLAYLAKNGVTSMVTSPHTHGKMNIALNDGDYKDRRLAIWFGNEVRGVSPEVIQSATACIQIPMFGMIESFNLAVSTGIVMNVVAEKRRANYLALSNNIY